MLCGTQYRAIKWKWRYVEGGKSYVEVMWGGEHTWGYGEGDGGIHVEVVWTGGHT